MRDQVIQIVVEGDWGSHTCQRVEELGKHTVSRSECIQRVPAANARCTEFARIKVPEVTDEDQADFLVDILMTCPVADVLGIGYIIDSRRIYIQWGELDQQHGRGR
jgi:hypothetical protein